MNLEWVAGGVELLDEVGPLWTKLNKHHQVRSTHFRERLAAFSFETRKQGLLAKAQACELRVDLVRDSTSGRWVGYCIGSVTADGVGEVESIYVEETYRRHGLGTQLMRRALDWMDARGAVRRRIGVASGNEEVFTWYARFGFYPQCTILGQASES